VRSRGRTVNTRVSEMRVDREIYRALKLYREELLKRFKEERTREIVVEVFDDVVHQFAMESMLREDREGGDVDEV